MQGCASLTFTNFRIMYRRKFNVDFDLLRPGMSATLFFSQVPGLRVEEKPTGVTIHNQISSSESDFPITNVRVVEDQLLESAPAFVCTICQDCVITKAKLLPCAHMFCASCIDTWAAKYQSLPEFKNWAAMARQKTPTMKTAPCPLCNTSSPLEQFKTISAQSVFPERAIYVLIHSLRICCRYSPLGCSWTGSIGTYGSHLKSCVFHLEAHAGKVDKLEELPDEDVPVVRIPGGIFACSSQPPEAPQQSEWSRVRQSYFVDKEAFQLENWSFVHTLREIPGCGGLTPLEIQRGLLSEDLRDDTRVADDIIACAAEYVTSSTSKTQFNQSRTKVANQFCQSAVASVFGSAHGSGMVLDVDDGPPNLPHGTPTSASGSFGAAQFALARLDAPVENPPANYGPALGTYRVVGSYTPPEGADAGATPFLHVSHGDTVEVFQKNEAGWAFGRKMYLKSAAAVSSLMQQHSAHLLPCGAAGNTNFAASTFGLPPVDANSAIPLSSANKFKSLPANSSIVSSAGWFPSHLLSLGVDMTSGCPAQLAPRSLNFVRPNSQQHQNLKTEEPLNPLFVAKVVVSFDFTNSSSSTGGITSTLKSATTANNLTAADSVLLTVANGDEVRVFTPDVRGWVYVQVTKLGCSSSSNLTSGTSTSSSNSSTVGAEANLQMKNEQQHRLGTHGWVPRAVLSLFD